MYVRNVLTIVFLCLFYPSLKNATAQTQPFSPALQKQMQSALITQICSDGGVWVKCYGLKPADCPRVAEVVVSPCLSSILKNTPGNLDQAQVMAVSQDLGKCFNEVFLSKYGAGHLSTPECKDPPKHLQ